MPKLKPTTTETRSRMVRAMIRKNMELQGITTTDELGAKVRMSGRTLRKRLEYPETFTLDELWRVADALRFSNRDRFQMARKEIT